MASKIFDPPSRAPGCNDAIVIVDPFSSGKYLVYEMERRKIPIIGVCSSGSLAPFYLKAYDAMKPYLAECIEYDSCSGVADLANRIKKLPYKLLAVAAGTESGVELSDQLNAELKMPNCNPIELLEARKDKAEMQDRIRQFGIPAAEQTKGSDLNELLKWARERDTWPLVAKPIKGAGSDGVYFCKNLDDIKKAHGEMLGGGRKNLFGTVIPEMALQEFLSGDEYIVDTVSYAGKHICVAMWVYKKQRGMPWNPTAIVAEYSKMLHPEGREQDQLTDYVFRVLDAVGLMYGPCHTEIMMTPRGPILVEVNARMHGLQGPLLIEWSTGYNLATYSADTLVANGEVFKQLINPPIGRWPGRWMYPFEKYAYTFLLLSPEKGYLTVDLKTEIMDMNLASVRDVVVMVQKGQYLNQTVDLASAAGVVLMVHESEEQIEGDMNQIRFAEARKLYKVTDEPVPGSPVASPLSGRPRTNSHGYSIERAEEIGFTLNEVEY
eukprot:TRINITY_DN327_c0_g2_i1.p1 TRINITY_DN327_c0_g2~~TRINITY_DN327_c0_g2_i1.p1  ORF type:complete len:493 (-),score=65.64 TRINITY_DN327_c0_g2_i1:66-1544(-)